MNNLPGCLIAAKDLANLIQNIDCSVIDCRFELARPEAGYTAYSQAHVPGAVYASLDEHLSSEPVTDCGRHPLPRSDDIQNTFEKLGVCDDKPVVLYDDQGGMIAARGWWMLRYIGHTRVAVLDGGWSAWCEAGLPMDKQVVKVTLGELTATPDTRRLVTYKDLIDDVANNVDLVDARESRRFCGEYEPIDARAGHIPGAQNHFFQQNLTDSGQFLSPNEIKGSFQKSLGRIPNEHTVHYCGSGVSACHNILAQVHAGLPEPKLYCGSWSEWAKLTAENEGSDEPS